LDKVLAEYTKLKEGDTKLEGEIKALETAADSHTKDNRDKRKALQERRNTLAKQMQAVGESHTQGQQALNGLYQSVEASLQTHCAKSPVSIALSRHVALSIRPPIITERAAHFLASQRFLFA
jgi:uncharacterized protein YgiM (DUF1202 family)